MKCLSGTSVSGTSVSETSVSGTSVYKSESTGGLVFLADVLLEPGNLLCNPPLCA